MPEEIAKNRKPKRIVERQASFEFDQRVTLRLDFNLAVELGELILASDTSNKAICSIGFFLRDLAERE